MQCYCRNCGYQYMKNVYEYYKPITSQGFPMCIRCNCCVDCSGYVCQCVRCEECCEVLNICRCDNEPTQYSNPQNAFEYTHQMNDHQIQNLTYQFSNMHL